MIASTLILLATATSSFALPRPFTGFGNPFSNLVARKNSGPSFEYKGLKETLTGVTIHGSCNVTERRQLLRALDDTLEVATVARDYVLKNGVEDPVYKLYFGDADPFAVVGVFDQLIYGSKEGVLLRCDNIDGNCANPGWAGHWRGENATLETVICPLSFESRKWKEQWCGFGYTVVEGSAGYYFATDLIHRFFHVPTISNEIVSHYADPYADVLELAVKNSTYAPINTHTLQYFASDVYARALGNPGVGCTGELPELPSGDDHDHGAHSPSTAPPSPTTSADPSCHTHADGEVHCSGDHHGSTDPTSSTTQAPTSSASATTTAPAHCHTHADGAVHCD